MAVDFKPADRQNVVPYLVVPDADAELKFVKEVFGAKEVQVYRDPEGRIRHAEAGIGVSVVMLAQASEQWPPLPAAIYVYVPDVDAAYHRALAMSGSSQMAPRRSALWRQELRCD